MDIKEGVAPEKPDLPIGDIETEQIPFKDGVDAAEKANYQREETLKEIEKLKEEIAKHSKDNQDIKGRFLHEIVIHDDENKETEVCTQTEPPKEEDPLDLNKLYKKMWID